MYFSPLEWLALAAAIGISIWCMAKPLGGPKYGLVLFGGILTVGGVAGSSRVDRADL